MNYINPGIAALWNALDIDANKHWMYALSEQVIQPNELGWSQWVNFNLPAITVEIGNTKHHGVVAVLSQHIEPVSNKEYRAQEPATLILEDELKRQVKAAQRELMLNTLNSWGKTPSAHENLKATADGAAWHATDSGCSCRCTKARCQCACAGNGRWVSNTPCDEKNPNCSNSEKGMAGQAQCMSSENQSCIFQGAVQLESGWPVSRHEPIASAAKSCRPHSKFSCPLSVSNVACECFFSWPQAIVSSLDKHSISFGPKGHYSIAP